MSLWGQPRLSGESRTLCTVVTELCASQAPMKPALVLPLAEAKSLFSEPLGQESLTSQFSVTLEALHQPSCDLRPPIRAAVPSPHFLSYLEYLWACKDRGTPVTSPQLPLWGFRCYCWLSVGLGQAGQNRGGGELVTKLPPSSSEIIARGPIL